MYQNDYIMRQIFMLTQWIRKQTEQHPDEETLQLESVRAEIGEWYRRFRIPPLGVWLTLSERDGVRLLGPEGAELDADRCFAASLLLLEEARRARSANNFQIFEACVRRSLYSALMTWHIAPLDKLDSIGAREWIETILEGFWLEQGRVLDELSLETRFELVLYYEQLGHYDRSENILFTLAHESANRIDRLAEQWFSRMNDLSGPMLIEGGLSRHEVIDSERSWTLLRSRIIN